MRRKNISNDNFSSLLKGRTNYETVVCSVCCIFVSRIGLEKAKKELAGSIQKGISFSKK